MGLLIIVADFTMRLLFYADVGFSAPRIISSHVADGSVRSLDQSITMAPFSALISRSLGEVIRLP